MATADLEFVARLEIPYREASGMEPQDGKPTRGYVEGRIKLGLLMYDQLKRISAEWCDVADSDAIAPGEKLQRAQDISVAFSSWRKVSGDLLRSIEHLRQSHSGYDVLDEFENLVAAVKDVSLMTQDSERVKKSVASLKAGRGISFERAMDELRANLR